jgi:hypothetical protein
MPDTRGRGPGEDGQNLKGAVDAAGARYQVEPSLRRAVCRESGLHGVRREARYGIPATSRRNWGEVPGLLA